MAALTVHFDDSGTHPEAPVAIAAGWIAPVPQWRRFTREWKKAKLEHGFTTFHMAEFMANNQKSEFADTKVWNERTKAKVVKHLRSIIVNHAVQGFSMAVRKDEYDAIVPAELLPTFGEFHYTYAIRGAIGFIEQWRLDRGIKKPIEYIFDIMTKGNAKREIVKVFKQAEKDSDRLFRFGIYEGCQSFRDKKEVLPLQAADMLAWLDQRACGAKWQGKPMPEYASATWNYFLARGLSAKYQTKAQMVELVRGELERRT